MARTPRSHRIRDLLFYVLIGVALALVIILLGVYQAKAGQKPQALLKWIGFAGMTFLVFLWLIRAQRAQWTNYKFWRHLVFLALIHLACGMAIVSRLTSASLFPFALATALEWYALSAYFARFLPPE